MVSSSKILTVSYGTFSCTAEGFEDPLAVVKETTHFFRGVVSNDRFFGAEPPQFDADLATEMMRARLAQGDDEGTLTLGQATSTGAASSGALAAALAAGPARSRAASAEDAAPELSDPLPDDDTIEATAVLTERTEDAGTVDLTPASPVAADDDIWTADDQGHDEIADNAATAAPVAWTTEEVTAPAPRPSTPESVAEKLNRIRAVVASNAAEDDDADAEDYTAAEAEALQPAPPQPIAPSIPEPADTLFDEGEPGEEVDDNALSALLGELENDAAEQAHDAPVTTAPLDDSVLSDSIASLMASDETDADAFETEELATPDLPETAASWDDDDEEWDDEDADAAIAPEAPSQARYDEEEDEAEDNVFAEAEPEQDTFDTPAEPEPQPLRARVVKVKRADFLRAVQDGQIEEVDDEEEDDAPAALPMADESSLSPEEEDELARELAAVKAELSSEFGDWDDEEEDDDSSHDTRVAAWSDDEDDEDFEDTLAAAQEIAADHGWGPEEDYLDDEDEEDFEDYGDSDAHLAEPAPLRLDNPVTTPAIEEEDGETSRWPIDLDAIDSRTAGAMGQPERASTHDDEDDDALSEMIRSSARKTVKMASPARAMLTEREVKDDDTLRLMDQTDEEMDEPEGNRRRSAIAHLRAAVAATKADRLLGRKSDAKEEQEPYREDLANVVRPRRPQAPVEHRTQRPSDPVSRPAPLKLVAEQRVEDTPSGERNKTAPVDLPRTMPVRPRRVRRVAEVSPQDASEPSGDAEGFIAYAEQVGASELPDLLEAAAAYMAYVEGRDQFSRPQLMSTVRQAEATESSREDRLRSFGQLLREGKIKKTAGGRFTASDRISFKPDRAAG